MTRSNRFYIDYGDITVVDYLLLRSIHQHNNIKDILDASEDPEKTLEIIKKLEGKRCIYVDNAQVRITSRGERVIGWVRKVIGISSL